MLYNENLKVVSDCKKTILAACICVPLFCSHANDLAVTGSVTGGCPKLTITGNAESTYAVQSVMSLNQTNVWETITNLTLPSSPYSWTDSSFVGVTQRFYRIGLVPPPTNNIPTNPNPSLLVWIPPGTFTMGSPLTEAEREEDETQHTVTLTKGFFMGKYLVRQEEYLAVVGTNPSRYHGTSLPVERVIWAGATNYCGLLTVREQSAGRLPSGWVYRLPTEAQWEYACRAGTTTAFYYGHALRAGMANFFSPSEYDASVGTITTNTAAVGYVGQTSPVGSYAPNPWGLYDMCGNVMEWCQEWYGPYPTGNVTDPVGPSTGLYRVLRGGAFDADAVVCRSALRWASQAIYGFPDYGFRVVLVPAGS